MGALLALAFGAGMLAPVNPCGFAVLPAFVAYAVDPGAGRDASGVPARLAGGLRAGAALTVGFAGTFTLIGVVLAFGLRSLVGVVPWLAVAVGAILVVLGLAMLAGWRPSLRLPARRARAPRQGPRGLVAFGAGYAMASASCTLPLLLAVITQALAATNLVGVLLVFGAYAAGSATLLLTLALFAAFASGLIHRFLRRLLPHLHRITGVVLALSGGYLLLYWLPQLLGDGRSGGMALAGVAAAIATWIGAHQMLIALSALGLIIAAAVAVLFARRTTNTGAAGDCCSVEDEPVDTTSAHPSG